MALGSILHIPPTNYHLPWLNKSHTKKPISLQKMLKNFLGKKPGEWASRQEKRRDSKINGSRQKNKTGDSKVESVLIYQTGRSQKTSKAPPLGDENWHCYEANRHRNREREKKEHLSVKSHSSCSTFFMFLCLHSNSPGKTNGEGCVCNFRPFNFCHLIMS